VWLLSSLAPCALIAHAAEPSAGTHDEAASLASAKQLLADRKFRAAATAYAEANERAGGRCGECLLGLARAQMGLGDLNAGVVAAQEAVTALAGDPLQGFAYQHLGDLLLQRAGVCEPPPCGPAAMEDLAAAGEAYQKASAAGTADRSLALIGIARSRLRRSLYRQAAEAASEALAAAAGGRAAGAARVLLCRARGAADLPMAHPTGTSGSPPEIFSVKGKVTSEASPQTDEG
jgi:hypothetical protein